MMTYQMLIYLKFIKNGFGGKIKLHQSAQKTVTFFSMKVAVQADWKDVGHCTIC